MANFSKDQKLKITVLGSGTSTGVPVIGCRCSVCTSSNLKNKRLRASLMVESEKTRVVIDTGPDFREQMLRQNSPIVDAILYTHLHADHVHGFDDLRSLSFQTSKPVPCYLAEDFFDELKTRFSYAFMDTGYIGAKPNIELRALPEDGRFTVGDLEIETTRVPHGHVRSSVFKFGSFCYATDFKYFPQELIARWRQKIHTMVASGIYFGTHDSHSTIEETLVLFEKLEVKRGYLSHLSHRIDFERDVNRLPPHVHFTYDNLVLEENIL